jgi:hypothetical protein
MTPTINTDDDDTTMSPSPRSDPPGPFDFGIGVSSSTGPAAGGGTITLTPADLARLLAGNQVAAPKALIKPRDGCVNRVGAYTGDDGSGQPESFQCYRDFEKVDAKSLSVLGDICEKAKKGISPLYAEYPALQMSLIVPEDYPVCDLLDMLRKHMITFGMMHDGYL